MFNTVIFIIIRFLPIFTAFAFINTSTLEFHQSRALFDLMLRTVITLAFWSMTEGVFMLWIREKNAGSANSRGYGIVALFLGLIVLVLLQTFRAQSTQAQFLLLLAALALRGMSRSSWEQGRPNVALIATPLAHSAAALLSFLVVTLNISWQAALISISIGAFTGAVELTRNAHMLPDNLPKWVLPLYRASIFFAPFVVGSLSLFGQLPAPYVPTLLVAFLASRELKKITDFASLKGIRFTKIAGRYILFSAILIGARIYS
jgi:hypothetical protein